MVKPGVHVDKFHEIAEIIHIGIAAFTGKVTNEGRAIDRREHRLVATNLDRAGRIARMLGKAGRGGGAELARQTTGEMHPLASYVTADIT